MLFSIPTTALKYEDIKEFVTGNHREGVGLDYKEDFPKALENTICAMANSYGGTILLGVKDNDGYPVADSPGLEFNSGHAERVTRIAVDNISPPLIPEVAVCKLENRCYVVIRVPQGRESPYTVRKNRVYIRTGLVNTPDDLATLDRIEWISDGRNKAAELRKQIIRGMANRSKNRESIQGLTIPFGLVSMSFGPTHPYEPLLADKDLAELRDQITVHAYGGSLPGSLAVARTVQGGISYYVHRKPTGDFNYLEINKLGYLFYLEDMGQQDIEKLPTGETRAKDQRIESFRIVRAIDYLVNCARKLYAQRGYQGNLRLVVQGDKLLKVPVRPFPSEGRWDREDRAEPSVDDQLLWSQEWSITELNDFESRKNKFIQLGSEIAHSFGLPDEEDYIRKMIAKNSPC